MNRDAIKPIIGAMQMIIVEIPSPTALTNEGNIEIERNAGTSEMKFVIPIDFPLNSVFETMACDGIIG